LPKQEQKAAQEPIDALKKRVAALPRQDVPPPPPQPVLPRVPLPRVLPAPAPAMPMGAVEVEWGNKWWAAEVLRSNGSLTLIHYRGWDSSWDEWVPSTRIRPVGGVSVRPQVLILRR